MAYEDGEELIELRLHALATFGPNNVARGNYDILNKGKSDHYAILRPGPFRLAWDSPTVYRAYWTTVIEIWQSWKNYTTSYTDLLKWHKEIVDGLLPYRFLGDSDVVLDGNPRSSAEIMEMWITDGAPQWLRVEVNIEWQEQNEVAFAE